MTNKGNGSNGEAAMPRLVKAAELKQRVVKMEEARQAIEQRKQASPALVRAPRDAAEARSMFDTLFKAA